MKNPKESHIYRPKALAGLFGALALGVMAFTTPVFGQGCALHPIALSQQSLVGIAPGMVLLDIYNGSQPGNFGWLTWTGAPDEPTLVGSLSTYGNSYTYINPNNPSDHSVSIGDWVTGKPGVSNSSSVRDALNDLEDYEIIVPIWDQARNQGSSTAYHVCGFARVRIVGYRLPGANRISATFIEYMTCDIAPPA